MVGTLGVVEASAFCSAENRMLWTFLLTLHTAMMSE